MPYGFLGSNPKPLGSVPVLLVGHTAVLPGVPLPYELNTFHAPDPSGGKLPLAQPPIGWVSVARPRLAIFRPVMATLASGEISPNTGARNELPQVPRIVRASIGAQMNATF